MSALRPQSITVVVRHAVIAYESGEIDGTHLQKDFWNDLDRKIVFFLFTDASHNLWLFGIFRGGE